MQQKGGGRDTPQYSTGPILRDRAHSARSLAGRARNHAIGGDGGGEPAALPPTRRCRRALGGGGNCM